MAITRFPVSLLLSIILCSGSLAMASEFSDLSAKAKSGDAVAQYDLGSSYANKNRKGRGKTKDDKNAVLWYTRAAEQGLATAQFDLGRMYITGSGVTRDFEQGLAWQIKAAELGLARAQFAIGKRYLFGADLTRDYEQALELISKAAEQGLTGAHSQLGAMYFKGEGVPKDYVQAYKWFGIAAANDDAYANRLLSVLAEVMDQEQIEEAQELAAQWPAEHEAD